MIQFIETNPLFSAAVFVIVSYAIVIVIDYRFGHRFGRGINEREKAMQDRLVRMDNTIEVLSKQLNEKADAEIKQRLLAESCTQQIKSLTSQVNDLTAQLVKTQGELHKALIDVAALRRQLEEGNVIQKLSDIIQKPSDIIVLGVWPDNPLGTPEIDQAGEANAIYDAGFAYVSLVGPAASRDGLVWEMDRVLPNVLEIGAHDDERGRIVLSGGTPEAGWWGELLEGREVLLVVLLYCRSNIQDRLNIGDVMLRAGVKAVVSFDRAVEDAQAVHFARMLYAKLAEGKPIDQAVHRAKLVVNRQTRDMVRLRTRA